MRIHSIVFAALVATLSVASTACSDSPLAPGVTELSPFPTNSAVARWWHQEEVATGRTRDPNSLRWLLVNTDTTTARYAAGVVTISFARIRDSVTVRAVAHEALTTP